MTGSNRSATAHVGVAALYFAAATGVVTLVAGPARAQVPVPAASPAMPAPASPAMPAPASPNPPDATAAPAADDYPPPEEAQAAPDIAPVALTTLVTGGNLAVDKPGQPVTVLTTEDIERTGGPDFTRVLALIPGVTYTRDGAQGSDTQIHMRGSAASDVLVMIDGVRMNDVGSTTGGFDFGTLTTAGIDRVDVLRGTNSVVWGSGAVGGVIALTTPETKGVLASAEVGDRDNVAYNLGVGVRKQRYAVAFNVGYVANDNAPAPRDDGPGGFHQWHLGGRGRLTLSDALSLVATARYADGKESGNGFSAPFELGGDAVSALETEQFSGRTGAHYEQGGVVLDAGYAISTTRRVYAAQTATGDSQPTWLGRSQRADLTGSIKLPAGFAANFGADNEWQGYSSSFDPEHRSQIGSAHLLLGWYGAVATVTAGARIDDHSQFGSHESFSANGSVRLIEGLRLRASYAQGFKAPTLYQLYSAFGNSGLTPETATSYDSGIEYTTADGAVRLGATAYRRDSHALINFVGCSVAIAVCAGRPAISPGQLPGVNGTFINVGVARADGVEFEATVVPTTKLRLAALYSHDNATDRTPGGTNAGKLLPLRPTDAVTASADWTSPFKGVVFGADLRVQSASWADPANTIRLNTGELTTLRASLPFGRFVDFYGRIENLFNDHTPTVAGYGTIGRGLFAGIRARY